MPTECAVAWAAPSALAAALTAAKPGMSGPRTGSTRQSESRARPVSSALPPRMPATYTWHSLWSDSFRSCRPSEVLQPFLMRRQLLQYACEKRIWLSSTGGKGLSKTPETKGRTAASEDCPPGNRPWRSCGWQRPWARWQAAPRASPPWAPQTRGSQAQTRAPQERAIAECLGGCSSCAHGTIVFSCLLIKICSTGNVCALLRHLGSLDSDSASRLWMQTNLRDPRHSMLQHDPVAPHEGMRPMQAGNRQFSATPTTQPTLALYPVLNPGT